jgi:hypothetical protein
MMSKAKGPKPTDVFEGQQVIEALYALLDARTYAEQSGNKLLVYLIEVAIMEARLMGMHP